MATEHHVLNLGAGVQSTALYLMSHAGEIEVRFDCAVFADTQEEEAETYRHLDWLDSVGGPPIHIRTHGNLVDGLRDTRGFQAGHTELPTLTGYREGENVGRGGRKCTLDYKAAVVEKFIRYELLGLKPGDRVKPGTMVHRYFGFSIDEAGRAARNRGRFHPEKGQFLGVPHYPLIDERMTRSDCSAWLKTFGVPHEVPRSACVFCPHKSNAEWRRLKVTNPDGWSRAVEVDRGLRDETWATAKGRRQKQYLHRSCIPLERAPLDEDQPSLFDDCEGGCGL